MPFISAWPAGPILSEKRCLKCFRNFEDRDSDLLLGVMRTGMAASGKEMLIRMERGRGVEDTWFTLTYAPLANDDGAIDRVICFCNEVTALALAAEFHPTVALLDLGLPGHGWIRDRPAPAFFA
jgi:hypothetical protein